MYNAIYFKSRNSNLALSNALKRRGILVKTISSPIETGSTCGLAVLVRSEDLQTALAVAAELSLTPTAVFQGNDVNGRRVYVRI